MNGRYGRLESNENAFVETELISLGGRRTIYAGWERISPNNAAVQVGSWGSHSSLDYGNATPYERLRLHNMCGHGEQIRDISI